jgi:hypothetical protein
MADKRSFAVTVFLAEFGTERELEVEAAALFWPTDGKDDEVNFEEKVCFFGEGVSGVSGGVAASELELGELSEILRETKSRSRIL